MNICFFCNVKHYIALFSFLLPFIGISQLLDNSKGNAFSEIPFFNEAFIKTNKIKSLKGTYSHKKMGDKMRETEYIYAYEFDKEGRLSYSLETKKGNHGTDTLILFYGYDAKGNLSYVRQKDLKGFWSTHYEYDAENRKIREEYRRDIDTTSHSPLNPLFERSTVLNFETMKYQVDQLQTKMTVFNNYGFPYVEEIDQYNADGYILKKEEKLKMTSQITNTAYEYTGKGWLSKITITSPANPNSNQEIVFKYDEQGNLTEKHVYRNGTYITDIQIIYNTKTGLISYILTRDVPSNFISILKFNEYDYF